MGAWINPHALLQTRMRGELHRRLKRTNGCITRQDFLACVRAEREEKARNLLLRLCVSAGPELFAWKQDVDTETVLRRKIGRNNSVDVEALCKLWRKSRELRFRTQYPNIAPSGKRSQLVSTRDLLKAPVLGVDVLVRPPTEFAEDRADKAVRNDLVIGSESLVIVIHGNFEKFRLLSDGQCFTRVVVGANLELPGIVDRIPEFSNLCERSVVKHLLAGDPNSAVEALVPYFDSFAGEIARFLIS